MERGGAREKWDAQLGERYFTSSEPALEARALCNERVLDECPDNNGQSHSSELQ